MKMTGFCYHRPDSIDESLALLAEHGDDAKILAGGQSLLPLMAMRLASPGHLIDVGRLPLGQIDHVDHAAGLGRADGAGGALSLGAGVRHATAERSVQVARHAPLLHAALPHVGHRAIRNRGTLCGSVAHADPAAELPAVALAIGARMTVRSAAATRTIAASEFFTGYLSTDLAPDELLTEIVVPAPPARCGAAVYEVSRRHGDFALVGAAVQVALAESGDVSAAAIALFGVASTPVRVAEAENALSGRDPTDAAFDDAIAAVRAAIDPVGDLHASAAYRRHVAGVVVRRALAQAVTLARSEAAVTP